MIIITFIWNRDLCPITSPLLLIFIFMKNEFKQENDLYPRTVKRKLTSSKNSSTLSGDSTLIPYQALMLLKPLFKHLLTILTGYGTDTLRWSTSLDISKHGGMITVIKT